MSTLLKALPSRTRFILMPRKGMQVRARTHEADLLMSFSLKRELTFGFRGRNDVRVLDQIREDGPRLIEVATSEVMNFRAQFAPLRLVAIRHFHPQVEQLTLSRPLHQARPLAGRQQAVIVTDSSGEPLAGCQVIGFTNLATRGGAEAVTDALGTATLHLPSQTRRLDALLVRAPHGHWSHLQRDVPLSASPAQVRLRALAHCSDVLTHLYRDTPPQAGQGLHVALVDTGVSPHPALSIAAGANTVVGEDPTDFHDNGLGHGTHAAGIIAARPGAGVQSLAPAALLHAFRVFGQGETSATNYAIVKAIDQAVRDGCHLINLGLGGSQSDEATVDAINLAMSAGALVVAAAGNGGRRPVCFPATFPGVVAVSAFGRKGAYPAHSAHGWYEDLPLGQNDTTNYLARFSSIGPHTRFTGPGVGAISTFPGGLAALDGTGVAASAVTGRLAAMWSDDSGLMAMQGNLLRTAAVLNTAMVAGRLLGFGAHFEGDGYL